MMSRELSKAAYFLASLCHTPEEQLQVFEGALEGRFEGLNLHRLHDLVDAFVESKLGLTASTLNALLDNRHAIEAVFRAEADVPLVVVEHVARHATSKRLMRLAASCPRMAELDEDAQLRVAKFKDTETRILVSQNAALPVEIRAAALVARDTKGSPLPKVEDMRLPNSLEEVLSPADWETLAGSAAPWVLSRVVIAAPKPELRQQAFLTLAALLPSQDDELPPCQSKHELRRLRNFLLAVVNAIKSCAAKWPLALPSIPRFSSVPHQVAAPRGESQLDRLRRTTAGLFEAAKQVRLEAIQEGAGLSRFMSAVGLSIDELRGQLEAVDSSERWDIVRQAANALDESVVLSLDEAVAFIGLVPGWSAQALGLIAPRLAPGVIDELVDRVDLSRFDAYAKAAAVREANPRSPATLAKVLRARDYILYATPEEMDALLSDFRVNIALLSQLVPGWDRSMWDLLLVCSRA